MSPMRVGTRFAIMFGYVTEWRIQKKGDGSMKTREKIRLKFTTTIHWQWNVSQEMRFELSPRNIGFKGEEK